MLSLDSWFVNLQTRSFYHFLCPYTFPLVFAVDFNLVPDISYCIYCIMTEFVPNLNAAVKRNWISFLLSFVQRSNVYGIRKNLRSPHCWKVARLSSFNFFSKIASVVFIPDVSVPWPRFSNSPFATFFELRFCISNPLRNLSPNTKPELTNCQFIEFHCLPSW